MRVPSLSGSADAPSDSGAYPLPAFIKHDPTTTNSGGAGSEQCGSLPSSGRVSVFSFDETIR